MTEGKEAGKVRETVPGSTQRPVLLPIQNRVVSEHRQLHWMDDNCFTRRKAFIKASPRKMELWPAAFLFRNFLPRDDGGW